MARARSNLVLVVAGDDSQHPNWFLPDRTYDLWVSYVGTDDNMRQLFATHCDRLLPGHSGSKEALLVSLGDEVSHYEYVWLPEDCMCPYYGTGMINILFAAVEEVGIDWFQPASVDDCIWPVHVMSKFLDPRCVESSRRKNALYHTVNFACRLSHGFSKRALLDVLMPLGKKEATEEALIKGMKKLKGGMTAVLDCLPVFSVRPPQCTWPATSQKTYEVFLEAR
jgi:hypothetical protein